MLGFCATIVKLRLGRQPRAGRGDGAPSTDNWAGVRANVADPVTDAKAVQSVVERFPEKYGAKDVRKYYSKFDKAVLLATMRWPS